MTDSKKKEEEEKMVSHKPSTSGSSHMVHVVSSPLHSCSEQSHSDTNEAPEVTPVIELNAANSVDTRQKRQQRVFDMMKTLQQKHLQDVMMTEMSDRDTWEISESQNICRICHSIGEEPLVTPCHCSGSAKFVHATCLLTWFKKAVKNTCELCRCKVAIKKKGKPFAEWRKPEDKPIPLIWFIVFLVGLFLNVFSISVNASELCITTACVIFYVVNGFGVVLDAAFLYFWWTKCLFYWRKWCALNQDWSIVSCPAPVVPQRPHEERSLRCLQISQIV